MQGKLYQGKPLVGEDNSELAQFIEMCFDLKSPENNRLEELETKIACEKLAKPKVSAAFMTFWIHLFRKLDVQQKAHRKMLIDTFLILVDAGLG